MFFLFFGTLSWGWGVHLWVNHKMLQHFLQYFVNALSTGTSKSTEPYNIGTKATDVMLEIFNLDKKEVLSIDGISNQEFSQVIITYCYCTFGFKIIVFYLLVRVILCHLFGFL